MALVTLIVAIILLATLIAILLFHTRKTYDGSDILNTTFLEPFELSSLIVNKMIPSGPNNSIIK